MTISSETNRSGPYNGNGVTTAFDYEFRIVDEAHVKVVKTGANGSESVLSLGADYSVTGVGNDEGGQILCTVAPATGEFITNLLNVPFTQETDLVNQGPYLAQVVEDALDLAAQRDKQLAELLGRSVTMPATFDGDPVQISPGTVGQVPVFDENGNLIPSNPIGSGDMQHVRYDPSNQVQDLLNAYFRGREEIWVTDPEFGGLLLGPEGDWAPVVRAAIDKAVSTDNRIVYFPPRKYKFKTTLTLTTNDGILMLKGAGRNDRGAVIIVDFNGVGLAMGGTLPYVTGLKFEGNKTLYPASRALKPAKTVNTDDMDVFIELNAFSGFPQAIEHVGRGFICRNNDYALNDKDIGISWPTSGVDATGNPLHDLPNGFRKWIITGNHSHSSGGFLTVSGADRDDFRGAVIANNLQDIGRQFFTGGIRNSAFTGNVVENANSTPVYIDAGGDNLTFTGNHFGGMENNDDVTIHRPGTAVWFDTGVPIQGLTFTGNVLAYMDATALQFSQGMTESTVVGNTFRDYNKNASATEAAIRSQGDINRSTIACNSFDENTVGTPIRIQGNIGTSYILGNSWNNSSHLCTITGTVANDNMIERRVGEFLGRFAFVGDKGVLVKALSSFNGTWTAFEVMGGFAVETEDVSGGGAGIAGAFRQLVETSTGAGTKWQITVSNSSTRDVPVLEINAVGLMPVANNTQDLGSTTVRFRAGYFQSINLAGILLVTSAGTPEAVVTAPVGSWCSDTTNGVSYMKKTGTGNTGWKLVTQAA